MHLAQWNPPELEVGRDPPKGIVGWNPLEQEVLQLTGTRTGGAPAEGAEAGRAEGVTAAGAEAGRAEGAVAGGAETDRTGGALAGEVGAGE